MVDRIKADAIGDEGSIATRAMARTPAASGRTSREFAPYLK
jgi:hypothetical protein